MKIESVRVVRDRLSEMIKNLPDGPVIITKNGRPCAALVSLGEQADLEAFLVAHNPRLMSLMERALAEPGSIPLVAVEREVSKRLRKQKPRRKLSA